MATENGSARIGKSVVIRGEVKGGEDLIVDGRVEGTVTLTESRLTIGPSANIAADLSARDILIQGNVQGNIVGEVSDLVEAVRPRHADVAGLQRRDVDGRVVVEGDVRALRLAIEDNAVFRGKVDLTQGAKAPEAAPASAKA